MRCPCVYCLYLAGWVSFSTRAPVKSPITVNQWRTDPYFKSQLYVEDTDHQSRYSLYRMDRVNPKSERTTEILILPWVGFEPTTSWSSPACYHWAIIALTWDSPVYLVHVYRSSYLRGLLFCVCWEGNFFSVSIFPVHNYFIFQGNKFCNFQFV